MAGRLLPTSRDTRQHRPKQDECRRVSDRNRSFGSTEFYRVAYIAGVGVARNLLIRANKPRVALLSECLSAILVIGR